MSMVTPQLTLSQTRMVAAVIATTRSMLAAAKAESWDTVTELEVLRREDLKSCFAIPLNDGNEELLAEALAVLLHLNEEIMSVLKTARHRVAMSNRKEIDELAAAGEYFAMKAIK